MSGVGSTEPPQRGGAGSASVGANIESGAPALPAWERESGVGSTEPPRSGAPALPAWERE